MKKRRFESDTGAISPADDEGAFEDLIGLGAFSARKSYYPELLKKIAALEQSQASLKELNTQLEQRVIDRTADLKNSLDQLEATQAQLVESKKMASLGCLVTGVAHELNTPLGNCVISNSIIQSELSDLVQLLEGNKLSRGEFLEKTTVINDAVLCLQASLDRSTTLINTFKLAANPRSDEISVFNLKQHLEEVTLLIAHQYDESAYGLTLAIDPEIYVQADRFLFTQFISILITNSIVHGFKETMSGDIFIRGSVRKGLITLEYQDNGLGIDPAHRAGIFDPFYTTARGTGAIGLGLHIAFNYVTQALHGRFVYEPTEQEGVLFIATFPALIAP